LTIPALKDALRRSGLLGRAILNNTNYELGPFCGETDGETLDKARSALNQYFSLIRNANIKHWDLGREGNVCTNVSVQAYIMLLGSIIKYWEANTASDAREATAEEILLDTEEYIEPILDFLEHNDDAAIGGLFQVPFGSGGPPEYYFRLCKLVKSKYPDFIPEGMKEWEEEQSEENISTADKKIKEIIVEMGKHIFTVFKVLYGEGKDAYWDKGVPDKSIKAKAYERSLDDEVEDRLPLESYLDVIEFKKVVEHKQNWRFFKDVFNIPEPGEKGLAKNLKWLDKLNDLRRIPSHPSEKRHYKVEDFEYIDYIFDQFFQRLAEAQKNPKLDTSSSTEIDDA
jgi:DNA sulfur modification protein DndB